LVLGLAASIAVTAGHLLRLDRRGELQTLDYRFRSISTVPANDDILVVAIDDDSLGRLGRWPWPRAQLAGIVEVLQQCGARAVALDIIMPEPQGTRYESASEEIYSFGSGDIVGDAPPVRVFDDDAMATVLRKYPNVSLPMHLVFAGEDGQAEPPGSVGAKVAELLGREPGISLKAVLEQSPDAASSDEADQARRAYLRCRSIRSLKRLGIAPGAVSGYPARRGVIVPPLVRFAEAIRRTGFVTFQPDVDGVLRRIPLLARTAGGIYPQFALTLAAQELGLRHGGSCDITADASAVTVSCPDGTKRVIPVDRKGRLLINWRRGRGKQPAANEISIAMPGAIWQSKKNLKNASKLPQIYHLTLVQKLGHKKWLNDYRQADELYLKRVAYLAARQKAMLYSPGRLPQPPEELREEKHIERRIAENIEYIFDDFLLQGAGEDDKKLILDTRRKIRQVRADSEKLKKDISDEMSRLRQRVAGRICLVGSTATGAADFVPTPVKERMPGVEVHANILNTILSGPFVREAPPAINILVILLAGAAVTVLASTRPVLQAGPLTALLGAGYAMFNAFVVFAVLDVWLVMVAPLAAMVASFLVVTAYRQLTEERAKRHIRGLFAHALSPALVDKLIEDPSLARLGGERRMLSCLFSDLAGFTPLAERLGEKATVQLLNRYFDRMTDVVQNRRGGYLNKFLGDGIFVFFGAPVLQPDHARRALLAAADCLGELEQLNTELAGQFDSPIRLACRIGIATGEAMVGNCGSTQRMDYTAVGDCVNLASRLEGANKFFSTNILADAETWRQAGDCGLLARPLGRVRVVGRTEPTDLWNVMARTDPDTPPQLVSAVGDFARAMELYAGRDFAAAADLLEGVLKVIPDDGPARVYLGLCRSYLASPPPAGWDGVLELTEK